MPTAYKIEHAPDKRAGCKDARCKAEKVKFDKGEIRFGTWVAIPTAPGSGDTHQSWAFKHWGCLTPAQIKNVNTFMEGNYDLLEGYDALESEWQEKVRTALEQGHVDDEDWKWEPELNRPGARRTPKKKAKPASDDAEQDEATSPEPKSKKRSRKADEDDDGDKLPPAKKKTSKSKSKIKDEDENAEVKTPAPTKKTATKSKKVKDEHAEDDKQTVAPAKEKKAKNKTKSKIKDDIQVDNEADSDEPVIPKKTKTSKARAESKTESTAPGKKGRPKKNAEPTANPDDKSAKPAGKRGRSKKAVA